MLNEGDEENAYIFYMKFFNLIAIIQNAKNFASISREDRRTYLGTGTDIRHQLGVLEKLKDSLCKRLK